jgi:hypothetical protein
MSAPPIGITSSTPSPSDSAIIATNIAGRSGPSVNATPRPTIANASRRFSGCWPGNRTGRPGIHSWSLPAAMALPENVTAPISTLV